VFKTDLRRRHKVVGGGQLPVAALGNDRVVTRMVIGIGDERIEAHAPE